MIETKLLQSALVLSEYGNFSKAAEALRISQPSLTRQIQSLEHRLGTPLFVRQRSGVVPNSVGREVLDQAKWIVAATSALQDRVQQSLDLKRGLLRIGAGLYPANSILGPAFTRFNKSYPGIRVHTEVHDFRDLPALLQQGEFDFTVAELAGLDDNPHLEIRPMKRHQGFFFCRTGHPVLELTELTIDDLLHYPIIAPALVERVIDVLRKASRGDRMTSAPSLEMMTMLCTDWGLTTRTVAQSDAIGLGTYGALEEELGNSVFVPLPLSLEGLTTNYGIVTLRGYPLSPAASAFAKVLIRIDDELWERESKLHGFP